MSPRDWQWRIRDILESIETATSYITGMSLEEFLLDKKTIGAVTYELIIIGEAVRSLPDELRISYPEIPWTKMQAVRNVAVHEYHRVDPNILWNIITDKLPNLAQDLQKIVN